MGRRVKRNLSISLGLVIIFGLLLAVTLGCSEGLMMDIEEKIAADIIAANPVKTYTVTYFGNENTGGDVPVDLTPYEDGDIVTVLGEGTLVRSEFSFVNWNTDSNGTGATYILGPVLTMGDTDVMLYAYWTDLPTYTVSFNSQSGSAIASQNIIEGNTVTEPVNPTLSGYTFGGWFKESTCLNPWDFISDTVSVNMPLYAKWTPNTYTVTLNQATGSGGTGSVVAIYNSAMPTATAPTRTGNTFGGYYTESGGNGTQYYTNTMGSTRNWNIAVNTTLFAMWTPNLYVVTLNQESGSGGTGSVIATYGSAMPTATAPTRTGYTFGGYYTESEGNGTQYYSAIMGSECNWNMTVNTTLYAKWNAKPHLVTFNAPNGSLPNPSNKIVIYNATYSTLATTNREGYTFAGWWTGSKGTGIEVTISTTVTNDSDHNLYAKWIGNPYKINFIKNDLSATGFMNDQEIDCGSTEPLVINNFNKEGSTFTGWSTTSEGLPMYLDQEDYTMGTTNITLYAKWSPLYEIGSIGPAGGWVFYDKGSYSDHWRYLEASPDYIDLYSAQWGAGDHDIVGAEGTEIGTGKQNTIDIIASQGTGSTLAAQYCESLLESGYDDWFLPSPDELMEMFVLQNLGIGTFTSGWYWSSAESISNPSSEAVLISGDNSWTTHKLNGYHVRPIRDF